jgi:hypothetical protein
MQTSCVQQELHAIKTLIQITYDDIRVCSNEARQAVNEVVILHAVKDAELQHLREAFSTLQNELANYTYKCGSLEQTVQLMKEQIVTLTEVITSDCDAEKMKRQVPLVSNLDLLNYNTKQHEGNNVDEYVNTESVRVSTNMNEFGEQIREYRKVQEQKRKSLQETTRPSNLTPKSHVQLAKRQKRHTSVEEELKTGRCEGEKLEKPAKRQKRKVGEVLEEPKPGTCENAQKKPRNAQRKPSVVIGDSLLRHAGETCKGALVKCYPGIRVSQLQNQLEQLKLQSESFDTIVIHAGTNSVRSCLSPANIATDMKKLVRNGKVLFPKAKWGVSGVIYRRDTDNRFIDAVNQCLKSACENDLRCKFMDPNTCMSDADLGKDGLHLNRSGSAKIGKLLSAMSFSMARSEN